ncbi:hypothetical protein [Nocardiopsis composta]|uniref:hypothetical protein n=1 Tax=Nocardiopsis composta TaxID=157465 RepID=UPI0031D4EB5A
MQSALLSFPPQPAGLPSFDKRDHRLGQTRYLSEFLLGEVRVTPGQANQGAGVADPQRLDDVLTTPELLSDALAAP